MRRAVAVGSLALATAAALAGAALPVIFDPDPSQPGAGFLQGETWSKETNAAALALTRIDEATRTSFLRRRAGLEIDPFTSAPGGTGGFVSFHMLVENRTEARLVFQPQACRLETSWKDSRSPMDLPTIWTAFEMSSRTVPANLERIRAAIFDGELVLGPGEKRDGLLIYRAVDPKSKTFKVDVSATLTAGDAFAFSAFYKKRKVK